MKKLLSILLALLLATQGGALAALADTPPEGDPQTNVSITVSVTLAKGGELVTAKDGAPVALRAVTLSGKAAYTVDDALFAAHEALYEGGAAAGYASGDVGYGLSLTKLWGDTSMSYGYYRNNAACWSMTDAVSDGDSLYAFVYQDAAGYSDAYAWFDKERVATAPGETVRLTLSYISGYDPVTYAPIVSPLENAVVTIDGEATAHTTDAEGKVALSFPDAGESVVSAEIEGMKLAPPVCVVTAAEAAAVRVSIADKDGKLALAAREVTLSGKASYTIDDALRAAHEAYYTGGAEAGYASQAGDYGLSITKLWGFADATGASYSYWRNNEMPYYLTDEVEDGDSVYAFVYTYGAQDSYAWFDREEAEADAGKNVTLTLSYISGFDPVTFAPVVSPLADAAITLDGKATAYKTDDAGSVTFPAPAAAGEHTVSAASDKPIAPPVCLLTVNPGVTVLVTIAQEGQFVTAKDGEPVALRPVTLSGKQSYTVGDALAAAHDAFYEGGAAAGYAVTSTGEFVSKLWGDTSYDFGYYKNNGYCGGATDPIADGDTVTAFIYADVDEYMYSDIYAFFDKTAVEAESGAPIELTLSGLALNDNWDGVTPASVEGAVITIDGARTAFTVNADGKAALRVTGTGTHLISAVAGSADEVLVPPACSVTVLDDNHLGGLTVTGLTPAFSGDVAAYTLADKTYNTASVSVKATFDSDRTATVSVNGGAETPLTSAKNQTVPLTAGKNVVSVTVTPADASPLEAKTYTITVVRKTALSALSLSQNGAALTLDPAFKAATASYTAKAATGSVTVAATAGGDAAHTVLTANGAPLGDVVLAEGENTLVLCAESADGETKAEYTVAVTAYPAVTTTVTVPAGASLYLTGPDGAAVALPSPVAGSGTDSYALPGLLKGQTYSYTAGKYGYESASGTFEAIEGYEKTVTLTLSAAPDEEDGSSGWKNFRNSNTNNGVTSAKTPVSAATASLKWATAESFKTGSGMMIFNPAGFVMADGFLYTTRGNSVVKLDRDTGEVASSGTIDAGGAGALGAISLALGGGKVFVPLADGRVQALDAETLASLWVSEPLGSQCTTSLLYDGGYVYGSTGNGANANLFCLSAADENAASANETKYATWKLDTGEWKGSYWSTPVVVGNFVVIGTDAVSSTSQLLSVNKQTGEKVSSLALTGLGNQRSGVVYQNNRVWFTTANGTFATAAVDRVTGALSDLQTYKNGYTYSTATPVLYNGVAYLNVAVTGAKLLAAVDISDPAHMTELRRVAYPLANANAQTSPLLTTAYEDEGGVYLYTCQNGKPGALHVVRDDGETMTMEALYTPEGAYAEYCIASPICDENGTLYYRNDSGYLFAVQSSIGVKLDQSALALAVGDSATLTATVSVPGDAALVWTSGSPSVAAVSEGVVTALSAGSAIVTAATADGRYSASCLVVVKATTVIYSENSTAYAAEATGTLPTGGVLTHERTRTPTDKLMKQAADALSRLEELDGWVWSVEQFELTDGEGGAFTVTAPLSMGVTMSKTYLNSTKYTPVAATLKGTTLTFLDTEVNGDYASFKATDLGKTFVLLVLTNDSALEAMDTTEDTTDYDALIAKIKAADEGDAVRLNITSATRIPWEVFEALEKADPDVTLNLVASKYQWKFNSNDVKTPDSAGKTFDPWVRLLEKETAAEKAFAGTDYISITHRGTEKLPGRSTLVFSASGTKLAGADGFALSRLDEDGGVTDASARFLSEDDDCAMTVTSRGQYVVTRAGKAAAGTPEPLETPPAAGATSGGETPAELAPTLTEEDVQINEELAQDDETSASVLDLSEYEDFMREAVANQQALQTALTDAETAYAAALHNAVARTALVSAGGTALLAAGLWLLLKKKLTGGVLK